MDMLIRGIDETIIKEIDKKAKKIGLSRQEYLKNHIERLAQHDIFSEERNEYTTLVKNMAVIIGNNTEELNELKQMVQQLLDERSN